MDMNHVNSVFKRWCPDYEKNVGRLSNAERNRLEAAFFAAWEECEKEYSEPGVFLEWWPEFWAQNAGVIPLKEETAKEVVHAGFVAGYERSRSSFQYRPPAANNGNAQHAFQEWYDAGRYKIDPEKKLYAAFAVAWHAAWEKLQSMNVVPDSPPCFPTADEYIRFVKTDSVISDNEEAVMRHAFGMARRKAGDPVIQKAWKIAEEEKTKEAADPSTSQQPMARDMTARDYTALVVLSSLVPFRDVPDKVKLAFEYADKFIIHAAGLETEKR